MLSDRTAVDMIEVILTLAHKLDLRVIAEGIENANNSNGHSDGMRIRSGILFFTNPRIQGSVAVRPPRPRKVKSNRGRRAVIGVTATPAGEIIF